MSSAHSIGVNICCEKQCCTKMHVITCINDTLIMYEGT